MPVRVCAVYRVPLRFEYVLPRCAWLSLLAALGCVSASPSVTPPLKPAGIAADIEYLASKSLTGRASGTPGNDSAAVFLARRHSALGLPGAFQAWCATGACGVSYFQYFLGDEVEGHN